MPQISLWEEESFYAPQDFIVAGAGLAGLWTALELKSRIPSAKITIVERGSIPTGASTRNAGFACFGSPTEMISDATNMGADAMWSVVQMRYKGIEKIRKHFGDAVIDFDNCGGYECFKTVDEKIAMVDDQLNWLNKGMQSITGKTQSFKWSNDKLASLGLAGFDAMIENSLEGGLHSGKLVQALVQKVISAGVKILFGVNIDNWQHTGNGIEIASENKRIKCGHLIIATNAFTPRLENSSNVLPARGQVIVTDPIAGLKVRGTFHYDEGYYYFRNVGNRLLLGGARNIAFDEEQTDELEISKNIQDQLENFLAAHLLPGTDFTISHRWSGIMAFTPGKLPSMKEIEKNVWGITACNGMGVALTPILAEQVAGQFTGSFNQTHLSSLLHL
jgi:gamma-glutamylputrescine oxidase